MSRNSVGKKELAFSLVQNITSETVNVTQQSGIYVEFDQFMHSGKEYERLQNFILLGEKYQRLPRQRI
jgi:hypothetical protein